MEWTDIIIETPRENLSAAEAVCTAISGSGLYVEDYADLEQQVKEIAHIDLIEQALLDMPRNVVKIHLYLSPEENVPPVVSVLQDRLLQAGVEHTLTLNGVEQEDWENSWKQYYHTAEIGARLAVVPSWEEYTGSRTMLRLDPGMAFGTGTHETTLLCLETLDAYIQGGETLLDIGTGSGILSIAALLLGAQSAFGVDIDPMCIRTAQENAALNNVQDRLTLRVGDLAGAVSGEKFSIVTANIVAAAIIRLAPSVAPLLQDNGIFIASGIITERAEEVIEALQQHALIVTERHDKNGWVALVAQKS